MRDIEAAKGTEIAKRIAESKQKLPGLGKKEKAANREAVKALAAVHMEQAVKELSSVLTLTLGSQISRHREQLARVHFSQE